MREHVASGTEPWDGLRGIAILLVVVYHTWLFSWFTPALSLFGHAIPVAAPVRTGYLGVEIFFVISGFVLFWPYVRRSAAGTPGPSVAAFAERRVRKIVPSYLLALAVTAASAASLGVTASAIGPSVLNHLAFVQNAFNDRLGGANSVFWSLAIEVQFYVVFPAVAWAFTRKPALTAAAMIGTAIVYRNAAAHCCLQVEPVTRELPAYLDLFACGMLAAFVLVRARAATTRDVWRWTLLAAGAVVAGIALVVGADAETYVPGGKEHWLVAYRTLVGIAAAAFGVGSSLANPWWQRLVANRAFVFLGLISYNLYLWHTLVLIWMWKHGVPPAATPQPHDDPHWKLVYIALGWTVCVVIACAVTFFLERPLLGGARPRPFSFHRNLRRAPVLARPEKRT